MTARLMTAEELAARWRIPLSHVYRLSREGQIPTVTLGRYRRFHPEQVAAYERGEWTPPTNRRAA